MSERDGAVEAPRSMNGLQRMTTQAGQEMLHDDAPHSGRCNRIRLKKGWDFCNCGIWKDILAIEAEARRNAVPDAEREGLDVAVTSLRRIAAGALRDPADEARRTLARLAQQDAPDTPEAT